MKKDLVSIADLAPEQLTELLDLAIELKTKLKQGRTEPLLEGKTLAMIFEKPSLRTRVTFDVGMFQLGGQAVYLGPNDIQLGKRESVADVARNLGCWVDGVMARTFSHQTIVELARNADIPVINGLSDLEHPCQVLAAALSLREKRDSLAGLKVVFVGDGNNVANSLMLLCPRLNMDFVIACPEGYEPNRELTEQARAFAQRQGTTVQILPDPYQAVKGADLIYTDVWASMGQEAEVEERRKVFSPYQVNKRLLGSAKPGCLVTHCLPAHRGEEITDEVLDGSNCIALDEAENRLHIQKAILFTLMK
ncbi:MAG: ornithine carbamoyltransferase [Candidatus Latescibacteria bacterium]|nr:ornithine carbamoyltransferase [Candidatus Latescibacterota bacterium]